MKKIIALLLAMLMVASMTACSAEKKPTEPSAETVATEAPTEAPTEIVTEAPTEEEPTVDPEAEEAAKAIFGTTDGSVYTNQWLGLGIELDSDWGICTLNEILDLNGLSADESLADQLEAASPVMFMFAQKADSTQSLNGNLEKNLPAIITEELYLSAQLDSLAGALEGMGMTNVVTAMDTVTFAGQERFCIQVSAEFNGITIFETLVACQTEEGMALITASAQDQAELEALLAGFYALDEG